MGFGVRPVRAATPIFHTTAVPRPATLRPSDGEPAGGRLGPAGVRRGVEMRSGLITRLVAAAALAVLGATPAEGGYVATLYSGFTSGGDGSPFSTPVQTFSGTAIDFGASTGDNWFPLGPGIGFGAQFVGTFEVAAGGTYQFDLRSDDGSSLTVDGVLLIDNGGDHGPLTVSGSRFLAAGLHPFVLNFYENGAGESALDLTLPAGVTFGPAAVPEPTALALAGVGLAAAAGRRVRRRA